MLAEKLAARGHRVAHVHEPGEVLSGDFAFFLSLSQIVGPEIRDRNKHNLVVHESALPQGRGWSPLTWQILEGKNEIPIVLFEASGEVDSGPIYLSSRIHFQGTELVNELRRSQAEATIQLCLKFVDEYPGILSCAVKQEGESTYYARRTPINSRLDPEQSLAAQFELLRVVDNERYPAYFDFRGRKFRLKIEAIE